MLKKVAVLICGICLVALLFSLPAIASGGHGTHHQEMKKGILLVTFGTSIEKAAIAFTNIEKKVKAEFPDVPLRWAYTSHIIRKKLAKQGKYLDSVEVALAKMMDEGFTHIGVQSLHMIPGYEYYDVKTNAKLFQNMSGGFKRVIVGYPMLASSDDLSRVVDNIMSIIPKERKQGEAVILMGHGTHHPANAFYEAMLYRLQLKDPNLYLGTVEGSLTIDDIKAQLSKKGIKKAYLIPFMSVAGDHAINDMAGDEADSWKSVLTKAGVVCVPVLKGLAEYDGMIDIWVNHLKDVMSHY